MPEFRSSSALSPGPAAPGFRLPATGNHPIALSDYVGKNVILVFYPADWSPVCTDQLALYNELLAVFGEYDAQPLGISVDGVWCHSAFADARRLGFPLLADFEPKGEISRAYGVYNVQEGTSQRALFVIDGQGVIRWSYVSPVDVNPGADGILRALEELTEERVAS